MTSCRDDETQSKKKDTHWCDKTLMGARGHVHTWPVGFLDQAMLEPVMGDVEYLLEAITFT